MVHAWGESWKIQTSYKISVNNTSVPLSFSIFIHTQIDCFILPQIANRGETLVTASIDNTIALWDLCKIFRRCRGLLEGQLKDHKTIEKFRSLLLEEPCKPYSPGQGMMVATSMTTTRYFSPLSISDIMSVMYQTNPDLHSRIIKSLIQ